MSIFDVMSVMPGVLNESYTIAHARHVFSRLRDRCPKEYEDQRLTVRQAAELLDVDHRTLHQRLRKGSLKGRPVKAANGYTKQILVSVRDLADMLISDPFKTVAHNFAKRYTENEIAELKRTGKVASRSYDSYRVKAHRLGLRIGEIKKSISEDGVCEKTV